MVRLNIGSNRTAQRKTQSSSGVTLKINSNMQSGNMQSNNQQQTPNKPSQPPVRHLAERRAALVPEVTSRVLFQLYMQSFIKWLFAQNKDIRRHVSDDELFNYFIHGFHHPYWFTVEYLNDHRFAHMAEINQYLSKYGTDSKAASNYAYIIPVHPAADAAYTKLRLADDDRCAPPDIEQVNTLEAHALDIPDTAVEAKYMVKHYANDEDDIEF